MNSGPNPDHERSLSNSKIENTIARTVLANERTYAAWMRTGFAALVAGLAILKFLAKTMSDFGLHVVASILVTYSIFCFIAAAWRQREVGRRFPSGDLPHLPFWIVAVTSCFLALGSIFAGILIWIR